MYSYLDSDKLELSEGQIAEDNCQGKFLKNPELLEDEYFVASLGNISNCSE